MTRTTRILFAVLAGLAGSLGAQSPSAHPTIVLVHGAFADGSSWSKVIPILQRDGYTVIAVQNPLTSFAANVKALVYVAAFAPEVGEPIGAFGERYPTQLGTGFRPDKAGFLYIDPAKFHELFAADVPVAETRVAAATQKPIIGSVFGASLEHAAWKTIPSWYLVSQDDRAINPELERFYAKRMGAKTTEIKASHVAFLSHPADVTRLIEQAAAGAQ